MKRIAIEVQALPGRAGALTLARALGRERFARIWRGGTEQFYLERGQLVLADLRSRNVRLQCLTEFGKEAADKLEGTSRG